MRRASGWDHDGPLYSLIVRQTFKLQALAILLGLAVPPLVVIPLHIQQRIVDDAVPAGDLELILMLAAAYAAAVVAIGGIKFSIFFVRGWISEIVARILRASLVDAQRRRREAASRKSLGAVTSVLTSEVDPLGGFASEAINTPLIQVGTLLGVFGFMFYTEPALAAIGIVALIVEAIITPILQYYINLLTRKRIKTLRRAGLDMIEATDPLHHSLIIDGLHEIRETYCLRLEMNILKAALKVCRNVINHAADIGVLALGAWMIVNGETQIGVVIAFLSGIREIRSPWSELLNFYRRWADARVKYELVVGAMNDRPTDAVAAPSP